MNDRQTGRGPALGENAALLASMSLPSGTRGHPAGTLEAEAPPSNTTSPPQSQHLLDSISSASEGRKLSQGA